MMRIIEGLSLDDILLQPAYSTIRSRSDVDLSVKIGNFIFSNPIIVANMKTVISKDMIKEIIKVNGMALMHRFCSIEEQIDIIKSISDFRLGISVGIKDEDKENIKKFIDLGVKIICLDIAHAESFNGEDMTYWIKDNYPDILLISGNVCTGNGATRLWEAGADVVKCGVGASGICTTRIKTGNGVPQFSALLETSEAKDRFNQRLRINNSNRKVYLISDGGIKNSGDCAKCLCLSDMVMCGRLFAGCRESPGEEKIIDGTLYKEYAGSSTYNSNYVEGVSGFVPITGCFSDILNDILYGIKSSCSYQGAKNLEELKEDPTFIRITTAGLRESNIHDIFGVK